MADENDFEYEEIGEFRMTHDESGIEDISAVDGCADAIRMLMRGLNTRPGPDEEVIVKMVRRKIRQTPDVAGAQARREQVARQMRDRRGA